MSWPKYAAFVSVSKNGSPASAAQDCASSTTRLKQSRSLPHRVSFDVQFGSEL